MGLLVCGIKIIPNPTKFSHHQSAEVVKEAYFPAILSNYGIKIDVQEKAYIAYAD